MTLRWPIAEAAQVRCEPIDQPDHVSARRELTTEGWLSPPCAFLMGS
jgi:hypothetical protein